MKDHFENQTIGRTSGRTLAFDAGLRAYMIKVYNYMALGLGLTGGVAFATATSPAILQAILPMMWLFIFAPVGLFFSSVFELTRSVFPPHKQSFGFMRP